MDIVVYYKLVVGNLNNIEEDKHMNSYLGPKLAEFVVDIVLVDNIAMGIDYNQVVDIRSFKYKINK